VEGGHFLPRMQRMSASTFAKALSMLWCASSMVHAQSATFCLTGHTDERYNGEYFRQTDRANGQYWYKNSRGAIFYYYDARRGGAESGSLTLRGRQSGVDWFQDWCEGGWISPIGGRPNNGLPLGTRSYQGQQQLSLCLSHTDGVCDSACDNAACNHDNGDCYYDYEEVSEDAVAVFLIFLLVCAAITVTFFVACACCISRCVT
jgi:hypothetical protein